VESCSTEQRILNRAFAGRIENVFFNFGLDRQLHADLGGQRLFVTFCLGGFEGL
jgi:hypothetical protein